MLILRKKKEMFVKMKVFLGVLFLMVATVSIAQNKSSNDFSWDNMRYGGRLGLEFSSNATSITVAPAAIYQFNEKFAAGAAISFGFVDYKEVDVSLINYGGSLLAFYTPIRQIQLSTELEQVFVTQTRNFAGREFKDNYNYQALFFGAGYRMGNVILGVRYDVLYNENTNIYASPFEPFLQVFF